MLQIAFKRSMKNIVLLNRTEFINDKNKFWITYKVGDKISYEIQKKTDNGKFLPVLLGDKDDINICSSILKKLIEESKRSNVKFIYIENEDMLIDKKELKELKTEVVKLGLDNYVLFSESDFKVKVNEEIIRFFKF